MNCTLCLIQSDKPNIIDLFLDNFKKQTLPRNQLHLLIYDISNNSIINNKQNSFINSECDGFLSVRHIIQENKISTEMCKNGVNDKVKNAIAKTKAIYDTWMDCIKFIDTEVMCLQEDDIFLNPNINTFDMVYSNFINNDNVGLASAVTFLRDDHFIDKRRLAAQYEIPRDTKGKTRLTPVDYKKDGITYIDLTATGFVVTMTDYIKTLDQTKRTNKTYGNDLALCIHLSRNLNKKVVLVNGTDTLHAGQKNDKLTFFGRVPYYKLPW